MDDCTKASASRGTCTPPLPHQVHDKEGPNATDKERNQGASYDRAADSHTRFTYDADSVAPSVHSALTAAWWAQPVTVIWSAKETSMVPAINGYRLVRDVLLAEFSAFGLRPPKLIYLRPNRITVRDVEADQSRVRWIHDAAGRIRTPEGEDFRLLAFGL